MLLTRDRLPMSRKATVTDVAKAAGVSVATVSRAFNMPDAVKDGVRQRILEVADDLGYVPNSAAKALRLQRTQIVGAVIPTLDHAFFARMINSFQETLSPSGHMVFVLTTGFDNTNMLERVRMLVERGAEALLIVGRIEDPRLREFLLEKRIPVVTTYSYLRDDEIPSVGFDNYACMRQMVDYLVQLGHRNLVMIAGPTKGNDRQQARVKAFLDSREAAHIDEPWHVIERSYRGAISEGAESLRRTLTDFPDTTAIVCNSDVFAFGVLAEATRLGIRIPEDLSVAGHDDQELASMITPALTTIAVPAREMGQRAGEAILNALNNGRLISSVRLDANLIIRSSTAAPRKI